MDRSCRCQDRLHRARQPLGERLHRELQRSPARLFYTLREAQIVIESWRRYYNTIRPHASLGYKPPAPEVFVPAFAAWPAALRRPAPPATLAATASLKLTFHLDHSVCIASLPLTVLLDVKDIPQVGPADYHDVL